MIIQKRFIYTLQIKNIICFHSVFNIFKFYDFVLRLRPGQRAVLNLLRKHAPARNDAEAQMETVPPIWGLYDDQSFALPVITLLQIDSNNYNTKFCIETKIRELQKILNRQCFIFMLIGRFGAG